MARESSAGINPILSTPVFIGSWACLCAQAAFAVMRTATAATARYFTNFMTLSPLLKPVWD
jgi:hypothetical protein